MGMIKVIYVDQTAGKVKDTRLNDLIAKGKIAAFCISDNWVNVMNKQVSGIAEGQESAKERRNEHKATGNSQEKRVDIGENE